ncbi:MAG TPA: hypothetical protein VN902_02765 [Candidatus Acidoferrales bacterium]|jgi:hypothetical protein|nr:hypothetical protein [Candidatus Acidoferrales bacterium]
MQELLSLCVLLLMMGRSPWTRSSLGPRDRSVVTLAALIARSENIIHLAFYFGWSNAMSAIAVAKNVFAERMLGVGQFPAAFAIHSLEGQSNSCTQSR